MDTEEEDARCGRTKVQRKEMEIGCQPQIRRRKGEKEKVKGQRDRSKEYVAMIKP